jgi:hypothetical protein
MEIGSDDDKMVEISAKYQISMSPGGTLYSSVPATTPEEEAHQRRQFDAYMADMGGDDEGEDIGGASFVMDGLKMEIQTLEEEDEEEAEEPSASRKRKGKKVAVATYRCEYIGCSRRFNTAPLRCPSTTTDAVDDSLAQNFCSYECMSAWADYEIGDPLRERLHQLIEIQAGRPVTSAPPPFHLFSCETTSKTAHIDDLSGW